MRTCTQAICPGDDRCCGAAVVVRLWNHDTPLPEGATHAEPPVVTDHHRHYGSLIQLAGDRPEIMLTLKGIRYAAENGNV